MLLRFGLFLGLTLGWSLSAPVSAQTRFDAESTDILQAGLSTTAAEFIYPAHRDFASTTASLADDLDAFCSKKVEIDQPRAAYGPAFLDWQRVSLVQFGPLLKGDGPMRFQLWPDPKGFSARAIRQAVNREDPAVVAAGGLEGRSIALSNLSTLELLLFDDLEAETYACQLAAAIGGHLATMAADLEADWREGSLFRTDFEEAKAGNDSFSSVDDLLRQFLAGLVVHADRFRKFKISRGLGETAGKVRVNRTEARRSNLGLASILASLQAFDAVFNVERGVFETLESLGGGKDYFTLGTSAGVLAEIYAEENRSLEAIGLEDGETADELRNLAALATQIELYLKVQIAADIGLSVGFSSADGD